MSGVPAVVGVEIRKLRAQTRLRLLVGICALGPWVFIIGLRLQSNLPKDTLFGRDALTTGFAVPLVVLGFVGSWALPALVAVVTGDLYASEDHHRTWSTILARSTSRRSVVLGKTAVAALVSAGVVALLAVSSLIAGLALVGSQHLVGLTGQTVPGGSATTLVLLSWLSVLPTTLAFAGIGLLLSALTRSSAIGIAGPVVVGLVLQVMALVNLPSGGHGLLPTSGFEAWHGLLAQPVFAGGVVEGAVEGLVIAAVAAVAAGLVVVRRDVDGA